MATLDSHASASSVKLLVLGNSGAGKTGLLGSLASAGYRLIIADFDNGLDILKDPKVLDPKYHEKVHFQTFYNKQNILGGKLMSASDGWARFTSAMSNWTDGEEKLGGLHSWGEDTVFVIDSLTFLGEVCMQEALQLSGHKGQRPTQPDWGAAIDMQESIIEMLYNPAVRCNIVVTAHLINITDDAVNTPKLYPSALGKKFPPKLPRYFNNMVLLQKKGAGATVTRELVTTATHQADLKVSKPSKVPPIMEPDLGKLFTMLKG